ncbi:THAP domain-containing protein 1 [Nymphon striatum]|nr:THAP domain-containing protein 1 [Nymphon striatum]
MSKSDSESSVNGKQTLSNKLQLSRKGAKGALTKVSNAIKYKLDNNRPKDEVMKRLSKLETAYKSLVTKHEKYSECIEDEKDYEIIEEDLNNVQVQYLEVWTRTKDYINNLDKQVNTEPQEFSSLSISDNNNNLSSAEENIASSKPTETSVCKFKLERPKMPTFSGDVREYGMFKSDFKHVIEAVYSKRDAISLLRTCLSGKPLEYIKGIGTDYDAAWEYLDAMTFSLNCPSGFLLTADRQMDCLKISKAEFIHNHHTEKATFLMYPEMRRIEKEHEDIGRIMLFVRARGDDAEWSLMKYKSCKQEDKHSCGVFVMMNAEAIAKGVPPRVMSQFHCSTYRRYVLGKLLHHGQTNEEIISFGCRSGYKGETADRILSFHKFPLKDPELMQRWLRRLQRKNFVPTENSRLCSLHFDDSSFVLQTTDKNKKRAGARDFSQLSKRINLSLMILRRLVINAVPSIFPNCPSYMKSEFTNECSASRGKSATTEGRQDRMNSQLQENIQNFWSEDSIKLIEDVYQKLEAQSAPQKFKHITSKEKLENFDTLRNLMAAVKNWIVISETDCSELLDKAKDSLEKYMDKCEGIEKQKQCGFLREQIGLLESSKKSRRYSPDCLISSYLLYAAYPNAYEEFRKQNLLCFPSSRTLRSLTSIIKANESKYLKSRFSNLNSYERHVILMIDEIYTASRVEYSSSEGKIIGLTTDNNVAGTILTFMISSIAGQYRDVVSFYPINGINAKKLHVSCLEVLKYLDEIGFNVTVLCVDNHPVNRAFLTNILCNGSLKSQIKNPVNDKPLFLLFDPVHNIKNVYNNFQGKRIFKLPSFHLDNLNFVTTAKFDDLCELHNLEATKPIKLGYKLTEKCLNPTSIEKSSVKLSMAVFNESTENALRFYSDHENKDWIGTATFISHFLKLWSIINVKNKSVGKFKRDPYREPITTVTDGRLTYLYDFANFLKRWQQNKNFCLTKETFTVMHHMCVTLPQIKSPITKEKNWIL